MSQVMPIGTAARTWAIKELNRVRALVDPLCEIDNAHGPATNNAWSARLLRGVAVCAGCTTEPYEISGLAPPPWGDND